eukprot:GHVN01068266.1.p1 GENE.GHVN01068266.1~~GHVN01068266.1.p1  ORF type:complete len:805 (-),score=125.30 GHVN01068266.1:506-2920(-)
MLTCNSAAAIEHEDFGLTEQHHTFNEGDQTVTHLAPTGAVSLPSLPCQGYWRDDRQAPDDRLVNSSSCVQYNSTSMLERVSGNNAIGSSASPATASVDSYNSSEVSTTDADSGYGSPQPWETCDVNGAGGKRCLIDATGERRKRSCKSEEGAETSGVEGASSAPHESGFPLSPPLSVSVSSNQPSRVVENGIGISLLPLSRDFVDRHSLGRGLQPILAQSSSLMVNAVNPPSPLPRPITHVTTGTGMDMGLVATNQASPQLSVLRSPSIYGPTFLEAPLKATDETHRFVRVDPLRNRISPITSASGYHEEIPVPDNPSCTVDHQPQQPSPTPCREGAFDTSSPQPHTHPSYDHGASLTNEDVSENWGLHEAGVGGTEKWLVSQSISPKGSRSLPQSGHKGVSWNSRMKAWLAFYINEDGKRCSKTFATRKLGHENAREQAIAFLRQKHAKQGYGTKPRRRFASDKQTDDDTEGETHRLLASFPTMIGQPRQENAMGVGFEEYRNDAACSGYPAPEGGVLSESGEYSSVGSGNYGSEPDARRPASGSHPSMTLQQPTAICEDVKRSMSHDHTVNGPRIGFVDDQMCHPIPLAPATWLEDRIPEQLSSLTHLRSPQPSCRLPPLVCHRDVPPYSVWVEAHSPPCEDGSTHSGDGRCDSMHCGYETGCCPEDTTRGLNDHGTNMACSGDEFMQADEDGCMRLAHTSQGPSVDNTFDDEQHSCNNGMYSIQKEDHTHDSNEIYTQSHEDMGNYKTSPYGHPATDNTPSFDDLSVYHYPEKHDYGFHPLVCTDEVSGLDGHKDSSLCPY